MQLKIKGLNSKSYSGHSYAKFLWVIFLCLVGQCFGSAWIVHLKIKELNCNFCPPPFAKAGDLKTHSSRPSVCQSVCLSVSPSVTKTLTWLIPSEVLMIEHWYLACMILVTSPFFWYHVVTLTLTFDLLQGQICCLLLWSFRYKVSLSYMYWYLSLSSRPVLRRCLNPRKNITFS